MNKVFLVRHGENLSNVSREFSYRKIDHPLTAKGVMQAEQTAEFFRNAGVDEVYSSPLKRAMETAEIVARAVGAQVVVVEEFRELNVGTLEDAPVGVASWGQFRKVLDAWVAGNTQAAFPGGENFDEMLERVRRGIAQAVDGKDGKTIVIVAHGGIFTFSLPRICADLDFMTLLKIETRNCSISEIEAGVIDGVLQARLVSWASCDHLSGAAAELLSVVPDEVARAEEEARRKAGVAQ